MCLFFFPPKRTTTRLTMAAELILNFSNMFFLLLFQYVLNNILKNSDNLKCLQNFLSQFLPEQKANTLLCILSTTNMRIFFGNLGVISQAFSSSTKLVLVGLKTIRLE